MTADMTDDEIVERMKDDPSWRAGFAEAQLSFARDDIARVFRRLDEGAPTLVLWEILSDRLAALDWARDLAAKAKAVPQ
jgi:hypothetical protein